MIDRGGVAGEALYWATSTLFSHAGAHLVFVFLMLGGALLLTGRRIGDLVCAALAAAALTRRRLASEFEQARAHARGPAPAYEEPEGEPRIEALFPDPETPAAVGADAEALEGEEDPLAQVE